jgi:hypothetical protein
MTVHDALWASREASVKGLVQRPLEGPPLVLDVSPEQSVGDPVAELSFVLWGLWQARCATPPRPGPRDPLRFELDPRSAHASQRAMRIDPGGIDQETIVRRMSAPPSEERLVVRYADHDCTLPVALPRRIEMVSETRGWRAEVVIFEQSINERLDPRLFRIPADSAASQGDPQ